MAAASPSNRYAVFGHPIAHSLSPVIHPLFARQFGITLSYGAIDAAPADFDSAVRRFFDQGGSGANVTLPHKAAASALAARHTQAATRAGSANVLSRGVDGELEAHNTDGSGLLRDLQTRQGIALDGRRVLLLGAGGAARGVAWNLLDAGAAELTIANRSPAGAVALATQLGGGSPVRACGWDALAELGAFDLILHATSAGVLGVALALPPSVVGAETCCYDLSYGAAAHGFLAWARQAGATHACDGLGMLVETAAESFERWHGVRPATDPVYASLRERHPLV
jgi:shikimate dehydrogenase